MHKLMFFEFLKENDVLKKEDTSNLSLKNAKYKTIMPARKHDMHVTDKKNLKFLNEYSKGNSDDKDLYKVIEKTGNLGKIIATSLLTIIGFAGFINNHQTYAANGDSTPASQGETIKTVKKQNNNTLNQAEMKYYQEKIGNKYKFVSNKGMSGSYATAYKIEDKNGKEYIFKIPNNPKNIKNWLEGQKATAEKIKKYYKDYKGGLRLPNYVFFGEDFVIEENLGNQIGKEEFWDALSKEEVSKFINDMAEFLKYTHSQAQGTVKPLKLDLDMMNEFLKYIRCRDHGAVNPLKLDNEIFTFEDAYDYFDSAGALNNDDQNMFLNLIKDFKNRDISDEITCLTHIDIRFQNIVYNSKTKQFALIDFESLSTNNNIYYGFTAKAVALNGIPYTILSKIADKYNEISNTKMSKRKIKAIHKLGNIFQIAVVARFKGHLTDDDIKNTWNNSIKTRIDKIDKEFES